MKKYIFHPTRFPAFFPGLLLLLFLSLSGLTALASSGASGPEPPGEETVLVHTAEIYSEADPHDNATGQPVSQPDPTPEKEDSKREGKSHDDTADLLFSGYHFSPHTALRSSTHLFSSRPCAEPVPFYILFHSWKAFPA